MITLTMARSHLNGLISLATAENVFLPCVREYMRIAEIDMCGVVRADTIKSHTDLASLMDLQNQTRLHIDKFLGGQL